MPRPVLVTEAQSMASQARVGDKLTPTSADKWLGIGAFLECGVFSWEERSFYEIGVGIGCW